MGRFGAPYVNPRLWSATMAQFDEQAVADLVRVWARGGSAEGEMRCGVGLFLPVAGPAVVTVLQVDVQADVRAVPTQVAVGTRVPIRAHLLVPATAASVLLLPPLGRPFSVDTQLSGPAVTAQLAIDRPGTWLVQLMAVSSGGPRPVAQFYVTADQDAPSDVNEHHVPGESSHQETLSPAESLYRMLNAARKEEGLPELRRNPQLDQVALRHSLAMRERNAISHDTGLGNPARRVEAAGLHPKAVGENVARARSAVHLHRVLWGSPSHRENLLQRRWDQVGVSVVTDVAGQLVATQLFSDFE